MTVSTPFEGEPSRRDKLAQVPVLGSGLARVHDATEPFRPKEDDSKPMRAAKRVTQGAIVTAAAGVVAVAIL
jgi:hypothetical protein